MAATLTAKPSKGRRCGALENREGAAVVLVLLPIVAIDAMIEFEMA